MSTDVRAARTFLLTDARLLERHLAAVLFDGAPVTRVVSALQGFRTDDGGWGHALEPDLRGPDSQVSAAMTALGVLAQVGASEHELVGETLDWLQTATLPDGSVPQVLATAADHPRAPWMQPNDAGFLTYLTAAHLWSLDVEHPWLDAATAWCWTRIETTELAGYEIVFALHFLDEVPEPERVARAMERFRSSLAPDGSIPIPGGVDGEKATALQLSPRPGAPSRALFSADVIAAGLDALEAEQLEDGGWDFDFLHWSAGQVVEYRGIVTVAALDTLREHGRLA